MVDACRGLQLLFNFRNRAYLTTRCHNRGERERERERKRVRSPVQVGGGRN